MAVTVTGLWAVTLVTYLGSDVVSDETLCDGVNTLTVTQDVSSALRVVQQRFNTANQGGVDPRLGSLVVHGSEKAQKTRQPVQVNELSHKSGEDKPEGEGYSRGHPASGHVALCRRPPHGLCPQRCLQTVDDLQLSLLLFIH